MGSGKTDKCFVVNLFVAEEHVVHSGIYLMCFPCFIGYF